MERFKYDGALRELATILRHTIDAQLLNTRAVEDAHKFTDAELMQQELGVVKASLSSLRGIVATLGARKAELEGQLAIQEESTG